MGPAVVLSNCKGHFVESIRIHLGPMPTMLRSILGDLLRQHPDMVVVGESAPSEDSLKTARDERADLLITEDGAGGSGTCLDAILKGPRLGIVALSADGRRASAVNLVRQPILDDEEQQSLADAIRRIART